MMYPNTIPPNGFTEHGGPGGYISPKAWHHNYSATATYRPGTKVGYYNEAQAGWGTCIYLKYSAGAETLAAGMICQPDPALDSLYYVTGDADTFVDLAVAKPNAIALSAMITTYWGWFWCGGVCPDFYTSATALFSATTCATDDSLTAGEGFAAEYTTDGKLASYDTSSVHTADSHSQAGWVLADDGGTATDMGNLVLIDWWP